VNKLNISKQYHNDIFYPSSSDEIDKMIADVELNINKTDVSGLLLPHAGYTYVLPLLVKAFSMLKKSFNNIIIVGSPHLEILDKDTPYNVFTPSFDGMNTPYGPILFNTDIINSFAKEGMKKDSYFEEEPEFELFYPLIKKYFPNTKVVPICCSIKNSKQSKDFATILNKIYSLDTDTLIIVTSNMNSLKKANIAYKDATNFMNAIELDDYLLKPESRKLVTACGSGILDAVKKTKVLKEKKWNLTTFERDGVISSTIDIMNSKSKIVYHGLGILK
jgi:AmmeMemoRadiSam system protein B